jgi:hypothetical protein
MVRMVIASLSTMATTAFLPNNSNGSKINSSNISLSNISTKTKVITQWMNQCPSKGSNSLNSIHSNNLVSSHSSSHPRPRILQPWKRWWKIFKSYYRQNQHQLKSKNKQSLLSQLQCQWNSKTLNHLFCKQPWRLLNPFVLQIYANISWPLNWERKSSCPRNILRVSFR